MRYSTAVYPYGRNGHLPGFFGVKHTFQELSMKSEMRMMRFNMSHSTVHAWFAVGTKQNTILNYSDT